MTIDQFKELTAKVKGNVQIIFDDGNSLVPLKNEAYTIVTSIGETTILEQILIIKPNHDS